MIDRFKFKVKFKTDDKIEIFDVIDINFDSQQVSFRRQDGMVYNIGLGVKGTELIQCTGLKDNRGKLIYEGDIVKYFCPAEYCSDELHKCPECYSGENGSVHYDEDLAMYEYRSKSDQCPLTDNINTEEDLEIIGNIYENPELLKDGE